jgi:Rieske Fe-S protein
MMSEQSDLSKSGSPERGHAAKPCVNCGCAGKQAQRDARRGFMFTFGAALLGIGGAIAAIPILGTLFAPARRQASAWVALGSADAFPAGQTRFATFLNPIRQPTDGDAAKTACWVRCISPGKFQVFAVNCAHLGCPVRWFAQSRLFMCPCHGGAYYEDGSRAAGPPPRGLFEYPWKIEGGNLLIEAGHLPGLEQST